MRALVTGATGFVGSYLVEALSARGVAVAVLARPSSDRARLVHVDPFPRWIVGDLNDLSTCREAVANFSPDVVFHLGWGGVGRSGRDDRAQIDGNLAGTLALFDLACDVGCRAFVGLGSQAEYGPSDAVISEESPLRPTTLYGAAKASAFLLLSRLSALANIRFAWLRLFSAYGPGDHDSALIPYLIRSLLAGETPVLSSGEQPWDYLHVADAAEAIARVGESSGAAGAFNLASGRAETIRSVAERIRDLIDPTARLDFGLSTAASGLRADVSRLRNAIRWTPGFDLDDGLRQTVERCRKSSGSPLHAKPPRSPARVGTRETGHSVSLSMEAK